MNDGNRRTDSPGSSKHLIAGAFKVQAHAFVFAIVPHRICNRKRTKRGANKNYRERVHAVQAGLEIYQANHVDVLICARCGLCEMNKTNQSKLLTVDS